MDALLSVVLFWGAAAVMLFVSAAYFRASLPGTPLHIRLLASAHGAVAAIIYLGAMAVWLLDRPSVAYGKPFALLFLVPVGLIFLSFWLFRGHRRVHLLQVVNVLAILWALFVGSMAITGKWL